MSIRKFSRRPPSLDLSISSREPSPSSSSTDSSDDEKMSTTSSSSSQRPSSITMSQQGGSKRPSLREILSNTAPAPYSLTAFMAYLSQNHCLETLEFTMDANRYRKHFNNLTAKGAGHLIPDTDSCRYVRMLWSRLLDAYIAPNGPREVNLPGAVRESLLNYPNHRTPPPPETLDQAVKIVYELMEMSVLLPFLNSVSGCQPYTNNFGSHSSDEVNHMNERGMRRQNASPPPAIPSAANSYTPNSTSSRSRAVSPYSQPGSIQRSPQQYPHSLNGASTNASGDSLFTDDSMCDGISPMTPPSTPPTGDSPIDGSPRYENSWKKMTGKLSWSKKKAAYTLPEDRSL